MTDRPGSWTLSALRARHHRGHHPDNGAWQDAGCRNASLSGREGLGLRGRRRVPGIMWSPNRISARLQLDEMMSHIDLRVTLGTMAGLQAPPHDWIDNAGMPIYFDSIDNSDYKGRPFLVDALAKRRANNETKSLYDVSRRGCWTNSERRLVLASFRAKRFVAVTERYWGKASRHGRRSREQMDSGRYEEGLEGHLSVREALK
jgi:hypothetical protein